MKKLINILFIIGKIINVIELVFTLALIIPGIYTLISPNSAYEWMNSEPARDIESVEALTATATIMIAAGFILFGLQIAALIIVSTFKRKGKDGLDETDVESSQTPILVVGILSHNIFYILSAAIAMIYNNEKGSKKIITDNTF